MGAFHGLETLRVLKLSANSLDTVPSRQLQVRAVNGPSRILVPGENLYMGGFKDLC